MVKKGSKRGLNTGNTIRQCSKVPALRQYQKYGCLIVTSKVKPQQSPAAKRVIEDVSSFLPCNESISTEFSLNKQKRWELPENLKLTVDREQDNTDLQVCNKCDK